MDSNTEYNRRQYGQMIHALDAYERGSIGLGKLVANLEALLQTLEGISGEWRNVFLSKWGALEDAYALALDQGRTTMTNSESRSVRESVEALRNLVKTTLASLDT